MKNNALKYAAQKLNSSESERLRSLKEYDISDDSIDESFGILTQMAQKATQCSAAAISFLNKDKLFFKNIVGINGEILDRGHVPCEITITKSDVYEVEDLSKHPSIKLSLCSSEGETFKYYAGVPLINEEGYTIGTICVFDTKPQKLSYEKLQLLCLIAKELMDKLELRRKNLRDREALQIRSEKLINRHMDLLRQSKRLEKAKAGINSKDQLIRGILDNSPHLISLLDRNGHYIMVNGAVSHFLELPLNQIIGKHISEIHNDAKSVAKNLAMIELVADTRQASPSYTGELTIKGIKNYYQVVMIPVEDSTGELIMLRIATNVTKLKTLEVDLHRKNSELESLVYSLSHDLRGPISTILGLLNVEKYASLSDMRQYFNMIKEQTLKMDSSIHDLVELKNVTNRKITPEPVDMIALVDKVVCAFKDSRVAINLNLPEELTTSTDEYFIQIALNRVLANAVNYHRKDAEDPQVEVVVKSIKDGVLVLVKDNGMGITKRAMPRIFEMFFRGSSYSNGHGLGLYIAQNALNRMKGTIDVRSFENMGTEVEIFIPRIDGQAYFE